MLILASLISDYHLVGPTSNTVLYRNTVISKNWFQNTHFFEKSWKINYFPNFTHFLNKYFHHCCFHFQPIYFLDSLKCILHLLVFKSCLTLFSSFTNKHLRKAEEPAVQNILLKITKMKILTWKHVQNHQIMVVGEKKESSLGIEQIVFFFQSDKCSL